MNTVDARRARCEYNIVLHVIWNLYDVDRRIFRRWVSSSQYRKSDV